MMAISQQQLWLERISRTDFAKMRSKAVLMLKALDVEQTSEIAFAAMILVQARIQLIHCSFLIDFLPLTWMINAQNFHSHLSQTTLDVWVGWY